MPLGESPQYDYCVWEGRKEGGREGILGIGRKNKEGFQCHIFNTKYDKRKEIK